MAFIISMALVMYGFTLVPALLGIGLVVLGLLGLMAFVRWEARVASPILNVGLFRKNAVFVFSNLATLISYISTYAVIFLMSLYLQYNKGLSPQTAGLILLAQPVLVVIFSPIGGRLSDRIEPRLVASAGLVLNCVALLLFVFLTDKSDLWFIIAGLVICGIGIGLFVSPNGNAVMGSVEKKYFGVASGAQATMRNTGMVLSIGIAMILFSIFIGDVQITPEYYPAFLRSLQVGFIIFTALSFGGIFVQLAGRRAKPVVKSGPMPVSGDR